jgi:hypothetical protein
MCYVTLVRGLFADASQHKNVLRSGQGFCWILSELPLQILRFEKLFVL